MVNRNNMFNEIGELEEKYIEIIEEINRFGLIKKKTLFEMFGRRPVYRNDRIMKNLIELKKENYLKSYGQSYGLGRNAKKILKEKNIQVNYDEIPKGKKLIRLYKDNDLILNLNFRDKLSRIEYIRRNQNFQLEVNKVRTFAGEVGDEKKRYLVYRIENEITNGKITQMKSDIEKGNHDRVIVFMKSFESLEFLLKSNQALSVKELLVLPDNEEGIMMMNERNNKKFSDKNLQKFINEKRPNSFEITDTNDIYFSEVFSINLLVLDIKKMVRKVEEALLNGEPRINFFVGETYKEFFKRENILSYRKNETNVPCNYSSVSMQNYFNFINSV